MGIFSGQGSGKSGFARVCEEFTGSLERSRNSLCARQVYPAHHSDPKVRIEEAISGEFAKSGDERREGIAYEVGEKEWEDGLSGDIGAVLIIIQEWSKMTKEVLV